MFDNEYQNQLHPYLYSICQDYARWWEFYTLTDVVGKQQDEQQPFSPSVLKPSNLNTVPCSQLRVPYPHR
ncbi:MAG: hypothetical protein F6K47_01130 [Symploca sp. SIO2E6]|nr:hypothetical protein [Symploca sp. SIO2E6]